jgi:hypothetical protein
MLRVVEPTELRALRVLVGARHVATPDRAMSVGATAQKEVA